MNSNFPSSPENRLLDELLHEQNQGPDEAFLNQIETAVDAGAPVLTKRPESRMPARVAIAAAITLAAGSVVWWQTQRPNQSPVASNGNQAVDDKTKAAQELLALNKAIRDQEDKVEERRKVLATIVRTKGIIYKGNDAYQQTDGSGGATVALETFHKLEQEKLQLESQINSLLKYDGDQLMVYASGLSLPDNIIKALYPKYLEAKRQLETMKISGMGDNHPTVHAMAAQVTNMKKQLDEGVVNLRDSLKAQLDMTSERLSMVSVNKDESREDAIKRGLDAQDYVDARRDFESDQTALMDLKLKQAMITSKYGDMGFANNEKAVRELEGKVEESRKTLASSVRTKGIIYKGSDAFYDNSGTSHATEMPADGNPEIAKNSDATRMGRSSIVPSSFSVTDASPPPASRHGDIAFGGMPPERMTRVAIDGDQFANGIRREVTISPEQPSGDRYGSFIDQPWKTSASEPQSTFSIDVDTASYGNVRRMIREGREIPRDAVRIEECINAFSYHYDPPKGDSAFAVGASVAACPWAPEHQLVRIAIKGREIDPSKRPASNLVFLIDVSGSMQSPDKLPLLKQSMATLVNQLDERDQVAIVVYAGSEGVALPSTRLDEEGRATVLQALAKLDAGGSTNGGAGIKRAYELAMKQKIDGGVNRVILATDGDFNVGVTGQKDLVDLVKDRAKSGVYLTVLGFGTGNLNDSMMDAITRDGNGNYYYIDSEREGRKVFLRNLTGTLVTIAKDVKIQIEFNPVKVGSYRLIGYANRVLRNEDFKNDKVDAGDIGAGHTVTAFYELTPPGATTVTDGLKYQAVPPKPSGSNDWLTVKLRHKHPEGDESSLTEFPLTGDVAALDKTDTDFQFATAVALFGMKLRGMEEVRETPWKIVLELSKSGLKDDSSEDRAEFVELVGKLGGSHDRPIPTPAEVMPGNRR